MSRDPAPKTPTQQMRDLLLGPSTTPEKRSAWTPPSVGAVQAMLPGYTVQKFVARGGMGAVYRGVQTSLGRVVAIKILPPELQLADENFAERFKQEARAMGQLNHPGIVAVYDSGEMPDGTLYFVMEFVEGTDVAQMMAGQGRLPSAHAMAITAHVCDALQYAHEHGVVHRDIKPANIMVGYDGRVKVADFGLAKTSVAGETGLTRSGMVMGTLHFMAPEALTLGSAVDHRADIYAVGVMLYQMLTGKLPQGMFEMPSLQVPGLDPRYDAIITQALRESREQRYQQISEMRLALDGILTQPVAKVQAQPADAAAPPPAALPTQARPQRSPHQPYRPPQPKVVVKYEKKKSSPLVWLLVLALGGAAAWMYWERTQTKDSGAPLSTDPTSAASEPWERIMNTPDFFAEGDVMILKDGWVMKNPGGPKSNTQTWGDKITDGAIRAEFRGTGCALALRTDASKGFRYQLERKDATLQLLYAGGSGNQLERPVLKSVPLPPLSAEEIYHLEFRIQAGWMTAKYNGTEVMRLADDKERTPGRAAILLQNPEARARNIEWLRLEPDPRSIASVVAAAPPGSAVTPSKATTGTASNNATEDIPFTNSLGMKFVPVPGTEVLFCIHETRKTDYAKFADAVPGTPDAWKQINFPEGPISETDQHPVINVSWEDATAFCKWLSTKDHVICRLPTDREWSFAAGIGQLEKPGEGPKELDDKLPGFLWGSQWPPPQGVANFADTSLSASSKTKNPPVITSYTDGFAATSPVMSFRPNALGLFDLDGNVREWCEDWYDGKQQNRTSRGASWVVAARSECLLSHRSDNPPGFHRIGTGFRCVVEVASPQIEDTKPAVESSPTRSPSSAATVATKEQPFANSLGMKFVPVPGTEVLFCIHETRQKDYAAYAAETPSLDPAWKAPMAYNGFRMPTDDSHPVSYLLSDEAQAFCAWLSKKEGRIYRLPTDREWSWAVGIAESEDGNATPQELSEKLAGRYPWGDYWPPKAEDGNYRDVSFKKGFNGPSPMTIDALDDHYVTTSPVMSFKPNKLGIYDLGGNICELCTPDANGDKRHLLIRGGCWFTGDQAKLLSSSRDFTPDPTKRRGAEGFRCVVEVASLHTKETGAAATPPVTRVASSNPVDLLALVDPLRNAFRGTWSRTPDGLVSGKGERLPVIELPYTPPAEYDFEIEFSITGDLIGGVSQTMRVAGTPVTWIMQTYARSEEAIYGFKFLDGKQIAESESAVRNTLHFAKGVHYHSVVKVRKDSISGAIDGKELVSWKGSLQRFRGKGKQQAMSDASHLALEADLTLGRDIIFHKATITEYTPQTRAAPLPSGPTTWIDTKGRSITAKFVRIEGDSVLLDIAGKMTPVAMNTLSAESQKQARDLQLANPSAGASGSSSPASAGTFSDPSDTVKRTIELLPLAVSARAPTGPTWRQQSSEWVSGVDSDAGIQFTHAPATKEYDYEIEFSVADPAAGTFHQRLPINGRSLEWVMVFPSSGSSQRFGFPGLNSATTLPAAGTATFTVRQHHRSLIKVRRDGVSGSLDGVPLVQFHGDPSTGKDAANRFLDARFLSLIAVNAAVTLHRAVVTEFIPAVRTDLKSLPATGWQPIDEKVLASDKGITRSGSWFKLDKANIRPVDARDLAIRARFKGGSIITLVVRCTDDSAKPKSQYWAGHLGSRNEVVLFRNWRDVQPNEPRMANITLATHVPTPALKPDEEFTLTLLAVGDQLRVFLNDTVIIEKTDKLLPGTFAGIQGTGEMRDLEWLRLTTGGAL